MKFLATPLFVLLTFDNYLLTLLSWSLPGLQSQTYFLRLGFALTTLVPSLVMRMNDPPHSHITKSLVFSRASRTLRGAT